MNVPEKLSSRDLCEHLGTNLKDAQAWKALEHRLLRAITQVSEVDDGLWGHAHALFKNVVWRDVRAFWRAGSQVIPYLMYGPISNYRAEIVSFDVMGMRTSLKNGVPVSHEDFLATPLRKGIIIGNSAAAGVGASSDAATLASTLNNLMPDVLWFNLAVGGHNLLQNALALDLFSPDTFDYVVVCAGLIDFLGPATIQTKTPYLPPYIPPGQTPSTPTTYDIEANGWSEKALLRSCRRALETMLDRAKRGGARPLFVLQPHLALTDKALSAEEHSMKMVYGRSADQPIWKAHTKLDRYRQLIADGFAKICQDIALDIIDANQDASFLAADWLYLDYIHVNDEGHKRLAALVHRWINKRDFASPHLA